MLHDMYDAMNCVSSMFMVYECNDYACKLSSRLAVEDKSWTATGDLKILWLLLGKINP